MATAMGSPLILVLASCIQHVFCNESVVITNTSTYDTDNIRNDIIHSLEEDIASLRESNADLKDKQENMVKECDEEYEHYVQIYNGLLAKLGQNQSNTDGLEDKFVRAFLKLDELTHVLGKFNGHIELLALKIKLMQGDIESAKSRREYYPNCAKYGTIINFHPQIVGRDTFQLTSRPKKDTATVMYERKKVALDIQRDQEVYDNEELTKYLQYFTGYCQRRLDHIKLLIEHGKKHPTLDHIGELNKELEGIKKQVTDKQQEVHTAYKKVHALVQQTTKLQMEYDALKNEINCFFAQSQWHVVGVTQEIEKLISSVNT